MRIEVESEFKQMMFNYIYTSLLTILYTIVMSLFLCLYLKKRQKNELLMMIYFLVVIIKGIVIAMSETFHVFANGYNQLFMINPIFDTLYYLAIVGIALKLTDELLNIKLKFYQYVLYILFAFWLILVPFMSDSALKVWLYYLPSQVLTIYLGGLLLKHVRQLDETRQFYRYIRLLGWLTISFGLLIFLEDSFVIYVRDSYHRNVLQIQNRNISEDVFHIVLCMISIRYVCTQLLADKFTYHAPSPPNNSQCERVETTANQQMPNQEDDFSRFVSKYGITQREAEILKLLIAHKHNQEIATQLYLSIGTVKTHTHNIFIKLQVDRRTEVCKIWEAFEQHDT